MSRNIEIKAELSGQQYQSAVSAAEKLAGKLTAELIQKDTFFVVPRNRLKLRQFADGSAELIAYARDDSEDPVASNYFRTPIGNPQELLDGLAMTLGIRGIVAKKRLLYLVGQTRIHLDEVKGLGFFLELEVVLKDDQPDSDGIEIAEDLMKRLGVEASQLVSNAYIDLIESGPSRSDNKRSI